ncbi:MAG TPA: 4-hydroxy-tetrahydrodipicolinate reductase [Myxococcales bacterium]|nr:4-hydroxy-tetrahydrodipicolinate reductase [Myxococcales bacterium]
MSAVRVVVCGAAGRMGGRVLHAVRSEQGMEVVGATERSEAREVGLDAGTVSGSTPLGLKISGSLESALERGADVVIDFTAPAASVRHAQVCAARKVSLVIGTTGLSSQGRAEIGARAQEIAIVLAPNMSVGVNVLFRLVSQAARALGPEYEVEVLEMHHRGKKDAPSGTALRLAEVASDALGLKLDSAAVYERHGDTGARRPGSVGVQALRGGDVVGEHTVHFLADGERLELIHRATSRDNFARGAVRAARWVVGKPPALYDMQDVLGFTGAKT